MKWCFLLLLIFPLLVNSQTAYAEFQIDSGITAKQVEARLAPLFETVVRAYNEQHAVEFGGPFPRKHLSYTHFYDSSFSLLLNGRSLYSNVSAFVPELMPLEDCIPDPNELVPGSRCDWRRTGFKVCHLFMFNGENLRLESVTRLNIARDKKQLKGLPMCLSVKAMSVAKAVPDAMLITLGYIDSAEPAEKRYGPPEFNTTLLLRFRDENGLLKIEQDDSCLGNPNKFRTVAGARKALADCARSGK